MRSKTGLLMMVGVGTFLMLTGFLAPVYHQDTSLPGALAAGLMYGSFPLVFAGIAWQHPVPGGAIGIAYSVLSTVMIAACLGIEFIIQSPILRSPRFLLM